MIINYYEIKNLDFVYKYFFSFLIQFISLNLLFYTF